MQSTGQTATQAVSLVPMQGWAMMWAMMFGYRGARGARYRNGDKLFFVISGVALDERDPFGRQIVLGEDGRHRTLIDAHVAVDAGVGVNVKHFLFLEIRL